MTATGKNLHPRVYNAIAADLRGTRDIKAIARVNGVSRQQVYAVNAGLKIREIKPKPPPKPKPKHRDPERYIAVDRSLEVSVEDLPGAARMGDVETALRVQNAVPEFARYSRRGNIARFEWIDFKDRGARAA